MKKIKFLLFAIISCLLFNINANAASSISVTASRTSNIVVGNTITVTVTYYSANLLSNVEGIVSYNNSVLKYVSGSNLAIDDDIDGEVTTKKYTYTFKAIGAGKSTITVNSGCAYELKGTDTSCQKSSVSSATVNVLTQAQLEATYSKNNYLSSLSVDGATLSPEFNKDTLEYSIELENDVEKINVNASLEDSKASINGIGEIAVQEGNNKIEIKVIAQNGNERIYVINALVKELDPIEVKVNNKTYTVVRKEKNLEKPNDLFESSSVKINGMDVPSFINNKSNITVVGLKDNDGKIGYYIYDVRNKSFKEYKEIKIGNVTLIHEDFSKSLLPDGYKEYDLTLNKVKYKTYKYKANSNFYMIYALNLETGKKNIYIYDKLENTIQRYNNEVLNDINKKHNDFVLYTIIAGSLISCIIIIISIFSIVKIKKTQKQKINKIKELEK